MAARIKQAIEFGDISENAEYDAAMDKQANIEYEIEQLEKLLANVVEIDESSIDTNTVSVGTLIEIEDMENGERENYEIVASSVADPLNNKISNEAPVGKTLIGHSIGDVVEVEAPIGLMKYKIISISKKN